jgi:hypothetical protein
VFKVPKDPKELKVFLFKVQLATFRVLKELKVCLFRVLKGCLFKDPKELKVSRELVFKVPLVMFKDLKELRVDRERRVFQSRAHKGLRVSRALKA